MRGGGGGGGRLAAPQARGAHRRSSSSPRGTGGRAATATRAPQPPPRERASAAPTPWRADSASRMKSISWPKTCRRRKLPFPRNVCWCWSQKHQPQCTAPHVDAATPTDSEAQRGAARAARTRRESSVARPQAQVKQRWSHKRQRLSKQAHDSVSSPTSVRSPGSPGSAVAERAARGGGGAPTQPHRAGTKENENTSR